MKNRIVILFIIALFIVCFPTNYVTANAEGEEYPEQNTESVTDELIDKLEIESLDAYLTELISPFAESGGAVGFVKSCLNGKATDYKTVTEYIFSLLFAGVKEQLPTFISLFALIVFLSLLKLIAPDGNNDVCELGNFAIYTVIICIITGVVYGTISKAEAVLDKISGVTEAVYPILMTLTIACGAENAATSVTPAALFISNTVISIVKNVFFPTVVFMLIISVVSNLNRNIKLKNLSGFLETFLKWGIGLFATVFSLFLGLNGINARALDGLGFKTAKYTVGSTIPLVGGIVGDGLNMIIASAAIIKNALGTLAVVTVFSVVIIPIVEMIVLTFCLKLISAVTEPFSDGRTGGFISGGITVINYVVAALVIVAFMYIITFIAIIGCAEYILY